MPNWDSPNSQPRIAARRGPAAWKVRAARTASVAICTKGRLQAGRGPGAKQSACRPPPSSAARGARQARRPAAVPVCAAFVGSGGMFRGGRGGVQPLDVQPSSPLAVGAYAGEDQAVAFEALAAPRDVAQFGRQPAIERADILVGQVDAEGFVEILDFGGPHRAPAVLAGAEDGLFGLVVEFVFD